MEWPNSRPTPNCCKGSWWHVARQRKNCRSSTGEGLKKRDIPQLLDKTFNPEK